MTRDAENELLAFCVRQHESFDPEAWTLCTVGRFEVAATARYLAGTNWFGNAKALTSIADQITSLNFEELVAETRFDPARFRSRLQARLAYLEKGFVS